MSDAVSDAASAVRVVNGCPVNIAQLMCNGRNLTLTLVAANKDQLDKISDDVTLNIIPVDFMHIKKTKCTIEVTVPDPENGAVMYTNRLHLVVSGLHPCPHCAVADPKQ